MKKIILFIAFAFLSCSKEKPEKEIVESYHIYTIEPYLVSCFKGFDCGGMCPNHYKPQETSCMVVTDENNKTFNLLLEVFEAYEKGYRYQVKVLKKKKSDSIVSLIKMKQVFSPSITF